MRPVTDIENHKTPNVFKKPIIDSARITDKTLDLWITYNDTLEIRYLHFYYQYNKLVPADFFYDLKLDSGSHYLNFELSNLPDEQKEFHIIYYSHIRYTLDSDYDIFEKRVAALKAYSYYRDFDNQ